MPIFVIEDILVLSETKQAKNEVCRASSHCQIPLTVGLTGFFQTLMTPCFIERNFSCSSLLHQDLRPLLQSDFPDFIEKLLNSLVALPTLPKRTSAALMGKIQFRVV